MKTYRYPSVLTIAGFDGSGGAGMQADIKTISSLGCFATSVLTSLPIQNTQGVRAIYPIPLTSIAEQIDAIFEDIVPDAIKIGMVHTPELVEVLVESLKKHQKVPIVFDPVMVAASGDRLIEEATIDVIIEKLFPLAEVITPNMDEASVLAKMPVATVKDMLAAGEVIHTLGCPTVLLKGGHQKAETLVSYFIDREEKYHAFKTNRIETKNIHGAGCTLSSAIASYLARGKSLYEAVAFGQEYVYQAIVNSKDVVVGKGNGPLNHFFNPERMIKNEMV